MMTGRLSTAMSRRLEQTMEVLAHRSRRALTRLCFCLASKIIQKLTTASGSQKFDHSTITNLLITPMATDHGVAPKTIGSSAGYPMDPNRTGELLGCIEAFRLLEGLIDNNILILKELGQQDDLEVMFPDKNVLENPRSQWYQFNTNHIHDRLQWFDQVSLPTIKYILKQLTLVRERYWKHWHSYTASKLSDQMKYYIAEVRALGLALVASLQNTQSTGPYRIEMLDESKTYLQSMHAIMFRWAESCPGFGECNNRGFEIWLKPVWKVQSDGQDGKTWTDTDKLSYSMEIPSQKSSPTLVPDSSSDVEHQVAMEPETQLESSSDDWDVERHNWTKSSR